MVQYWWMGGGDHSSKTFIIFRLENIFFTILFLNFVLQVKNMQGFLVSCAARITIIIFFKSYKQVCCFFWVIGIEFANT